MAASPRVLETEPMKAKSTKMESMKVARSSCGRCDYQQVGNFMTTELPVTAKRVRGTPRTVEAGPAGEDATRINLAGVEDGRGSVGIAVFLLVLVSRGRLD